MIGLAVALAAGVGAVARYVLDQVVQHRADTELPYGTFLVNTSGSLLLGLVTGLSVHHGLSPTIAATVGVGFAGGYTTLSTWAWESLALAQTGKLLAAAVNVVASFAVCLVAAAAGLGLALLRA